MKNLVFLILISLLSNLFAQNDWITIGTDRTRSVSGIAIAGDKIVVVHDNKRDYEGRAGIVQLDQKKAAYQTLEWPDEILPFDLEALATIPGSLTDMIAMESQGKCHLLIFDHAKMRLVYNGYIQIPGINWPTNLEGFDIMSFGQKTMAVWGHRGKSKYPGKLYWGWMDLNQKVIHPLDSLEISIPWPTEHVRHIADLKLDESGRCWISATSDPGDDGPFSSAIYLIGQFQLKDNRMPFHLVTNANPVFMFKQHKVEAFELIENGILVATDDENFGGYIKTVYFK
ncbi:MAG: hypothetical protein ACE5D0_03265 [Fidelibacterota bacterium]